MNLVLNEEETILKRGAHEYFGERLPVAALRRLRDEHDADGFERAAWAEMADMGWAGVLLPEAYGGAGFGYRGLGQILEEAGRTLAASPLVATVLSAAPLVLAAGSEAQREAILPAVAAGECLLALAIDEGARHAPDRIATTVTAVDGGLRIDGTKRFVLDGHVADHFVVVARSHGAVDATDGITLLLVPAASAGVRVTRTAMVDSRNAARVEFAGVNVGADAVLGTIGEGYPALERALDGARAGLAAEMLGSGLEAFERTVAYLKLREQFGQKIGAFQALKHRAALMYCEIELTRSAVLAALDALDADSAEAPALASLAKAQACEMLELVSNEAVQMHGGIGMTDAEEIGFFLKRARVAQQTFGDAAYHRDRYARLAGF
ncbi:MAG: acyl-CoA dehydrogenase family protein [Gammaproteobacteria bacterium]|nr:acyl-CoA dehydrogenase family protein [Gammaproteobacteria bacterium]